MTVWSWVDAYDPEGDNTYIQTHTGSALPYVNWAPNRPDRLDEKCAYFSTKRYTWNDNPCEKSVHFICEYDVL